MLTHINQAALLKLALEAKTDGLLKPSGSEWQWPCGNFTQFEDHEFVGYHAVPAIEDGESKFYAAFWDAHLSGYYAKRGLTSETLPQITCPVCAMAADAAREGTLVDVAALSKAIRIERLRVRAAAFAKSERAP